MSFKMYDTLNIGCDLNWTGTPFEEVLSHHSDWKMEVSAQTGEVHKYKRQDKNLGVYLHPKGYLNIYGSCSKYIAGDNFYSPTFVELKKYVYELSDRYGVNLFTAKANRIDVSHSLNMDNDPRLYYSGLGQSQDSKTRVEVADGTLEYRGTDSTLCIYDKVKQSKAKHSKIPDNYYGKNVLRVESRWTTNASISKMLGLRFNTRNWTDKQREDAKPKIITVLNEEYYQNKIFKAYKDMYKKISKGKNIIVPGVKDLTDGGARDFMLLSFIANSSEDEAWRLFNSCRFKNSNERSRFRSRLMQMLDTAKERTDLNEELDNKMEELRPWYA